MALEVAHIFSLAYGAHWGTNEFGRWIADGSASITSVQNGMLLRSDLHKRFDMYLFCINPDVWWIECLSTAQWLIVEIRTTTRLSSSNRIQVEFPENAWIGIFSTIPTVAPTNSYDGTTDKQF